MGPNKTLITSKSSKQTNLKLEEMKQLESFIKSRSSEIDHEIETLKGRLKIHNISLPAEITAFSSNSELLPLSSPRQHADRFPSHLDHAKFNELAGGRLSHNKNRINNIHLI